MNEDILQIESAVQKMNASRVSMNDSIESLNSVIEKMLSFREESFEDVLEECNEALSTLELENNRLGELVVTLDNYTNALKGELK